MRQKVERHIRGKATVPVFGVTPSSARPITRQDPEKTEKKASFTQGAQPTGYSLGKRRMHRVGLTTVTPDTITKLINLSPEDVVRERYLQDEVIHPWKRKSVTKPVLKKSPKVKLVEHGPSKWAFIANTQKLSAKAESPIVDSGFVQVGGFIEKRNKRIAKTTVERNQRQELQRIRIEEEKRKIAG
jgi:hypothetical protein